MTEERGKLSLKEKVSFGFGGFVDQIMSGTFGMMAFPIYNIALGVDAKLLGLALSVPRFVDALSDPIMGHISDNTRSKWGRRKPYILAGAILTAIMMAVIFNPPSSLSGRGLFYYVTISGALLYIAYTVFAVPYNALGYEITQDYDERTSVQAWRMVMISIKAVAAPWILKACFVIGAWFPAADRPVEAVGVRYVSLGLGLLIMLGTLPIVTFCKEAFHRVQKARTKALDSIKATLSNKVFRVHLITIFMVMIGNFIFGPLKIYLNNFYVYGGDKNAAATMIGYSGSLQATCGFLAIPIITMLSKRIGKKTTYAGGIIISGLVFPLSWFVYTPDLPALQLIIPILSAPAITCCWVLNPSITADICDYDELKTGQRREGMYGAVWGFAFKAGISAISLVMGVLIAWTGFVADVAAQSPETIFRIRLLMVVIPFVFLAGGGTIFALFFPLTRSRVMDIQQELNRRREESEEDTAPEPEDPTK